MIPRNCLDRRSTATPRPVSRPRPWSLRGRAPLLAQAMLGAGLLAAAAVPCGASTASDNARHSISGRVEITNSRGKPSRLGRPEDSLIFFTPDQRPVRRDRPATHQMKTVGKQYDPGILVVWRGDRVDFPNLDPILHNVFSVSGGNSFDLEVYGEGESRGHVFEQAGLVRVFCNVHREMFAHIWVLETDHVLRPGLDGSFRLEGLPAGSGTLTVWHERSEAQEIRLDPANARASQGLQIGVPLTRPRLPLHKNKYGKPYRRPGEY